MKITITDPSLKVALEQDYYENLGREILNKHRETLNDKEKSI